MKLRRLCLVLLVLLLVFVPLMRTASADLGDWSGGGDYGGGSSSDSDDCDGLGWLFYYGIRLGCTIGECAEESGCSRGQVIVFEVLFFAALIGLAALILRMRRKSGGSKVNPATAADAVQRSTPNGASVGTGIFDRLRMTDPYFSGEDLKEQLKNRYLQICDCRQKGDLSPARPFMTEEFFTRAESEQTGMTQGHLTAHYERIGILGADPVSLSEQDGMHVLRMDLRTRSVSWVQSDETGEIVSGSKNEMFRTVSFELVRAIGAKTAPRESEKTSVHCPFCGAPLSLNETAVCPYCDSVLPPAKDAWLIRSIQNG